MTRAIPVLLLLVLLLGACTIAGSGTGGAASSDEASVEPTTTTLPDLGPSRGLHNIDGWLQSDVTSLDELLGKVVVVQLWTCGCHTSQATLPNLTDLYAKHAGDDFEIVGIHAPEFDYESRPDAILDAARDLGVTWPIVLDTEKDTFWEWQDSPAYWPRTYVLDRDGRIRFDHIGEGKYDELNEVVATLLG